MSEETISDLLRDIRAMSSATYVPPGCSNPNLSRPARRIARNRLAKRRATRDQVVALVRKGKSDAEIAAELKLPEEYVHSLRVVKM